MHFPQKSCISPPKKSVYFAQIMSTGLLTGDGEDEFNPNEGWVSESDVMEARGASSAPGGAAMEQYFNTEL